MDTPNNIKLSTASFFNRQGGVDNVERVTFYVGAHGPFSKDFPAGQDNTMAISTFIQETASRVNSLLQRFPG